MNSTYTTNATDGSRLFNFLTNRIALMNGTPSGFCIWRWGVESRASSMLSTCSTMELLTCYRKHSLCHSCYNMRLTRSYSTHFYFNLILFIWWWYSLLFQTSVFQIVKQEGLWNFKTAFQLFFILIYIKKNLSYIFT